MDPEWWAQNKSRIFEQQLQDMIAEERAIKEQSMAKYADYITPLGLSPEKPDELEDEHAPYLLQRSALHAASIELVHPSTNEELRLEAPLAPDMARTLAFLRSLKA